MRENFSHPLGHRHHHYSKPVLEGNRQVPEPVTMASPEIGCLPVGPIIVICFGGILFTEASSFTSRWSYDPPGKVFTALVDCQTRKAHLIIATFDNTPYNDNALSVGIQRIQDGTWALRQETSLGHPSVFDPRHMKVYEKYGWVIVAYGKKTF